MFSLYEKCDKYKKWLIKKLIQFYIDLRWGGDPKIDISFGTGGLMKSHLARSAGYIRSAAEKRDIRSKHNFEIISAIGIIFLL